MLQNQKKHKQILSIKLYTVLLALTWSLAISLSFFWNYIQEKNSAREAAIIASHAQFTKDVIYRRWNALQGGVYVPVTKKTRPNPYLQNINNRDLELSSGKTLTLINPAYITRQVHELGFEAKGVRGHITSLNPIRPANAPDLWEQKALTAFEKGTKQVSAVKTLDSEKYMRFMQPLITEKGCLKCHAEQGYKLGDVRGGISVSMPMSPYLKIARKKMTNIALGHGFLWLLGLGILGLGSNSIQRKENELIAMVCLTALQRTENRGSHYRCLN